MLAEQAGTQVEAIATCFDPLDYGPKYPTPLVTPLALYIKKNMFGPADNSHVDACRSPG